MPSLLKPGSSKLKESEATLLTEIKDFERQEDKTLQNMEDTLSHTRITSTTNPMDVSDEEEDKDVIRTTPNLAISSRRSIVEEVTDDGAIQEMEFIADKEKEQNQDELVDLKHIEQELLKNQQDKEEDLKLNQKPMIVQEDLDPNVVPVEVPVRSTQPPGITVFENSTKKFYFVSFTHPLTPLLSTHTLEAHSLSPHIPTHYPPFHSTPISPHSTHPRPTVYTRLKFHVDFAPSVLLASFAPLRSMDLLRHFFFFFKHCDV